MGTVVRAFFFTKLTWPAHMMAVTQFSPFLQPAIVTDLRDENWSSINEDLASVIAPLHAELANDIAPPCEALIEFASLITAHLEHHNSSIEMVPSSVSQSIWRV